MMKTHAYLREKILFGLRVPSGGGKAARKEARSAPGSASDAVASPPSTATSTPVGSSRKGGNGAPAASTTTPASAAGGASTGVAKTGSPSVAAAVTETLVYRRFAEFIPEYAAQHGVTLDAVHIPVIDIGDAQTELGRFFYFLFAPTLIYRDSYPRSGNDVRRAAAAACIS